MCLGHKTATELCILNRSNYHILMMQPVSQPASRYGPPRVPFEDFVLHWFFKEFLHISSIYLSFHLCVSLSPSPLADILSIPLLYTYSSRRQTICSKNHKFI